MPRKYYVSENTVEKLHPGRIGGKLQQTKCDSDKNFFFFLVVTLNNT